MKDQAHIQRIRAELQEAGMTAYGFMKLETDHIPEIIHEDEHVKGVVYGRIAASLDSVMLVATDRRILFADCKPFYKSADEITYEVVAGIDMSTIGPFAGIVLHTRVKDYMLRFVNIKCAEIFTHYIESHIERGIKSIKPTTPDAKKSNSKINYLPYKIAQDKPKEFDHNNTIETNTAILSTINGKSGVHASVVHYLVDKEENYYFLTKTDTEKAKNISKDNRVALTIHCTGSLKSLLIKGKAVVVSDQGVADVVLKQMTSFRKYTEGSRLPPITKINKGPYIAFKITPITSELHDYSTSSW